MKETQAEIQRSNNGGPVLAGLLIGSLAGAGAMLLLAPESGREMRARLLQGSGLLRERVEGGLEEARAQVSATTEQFTSEVRNRAHSLERQGRDLLAEQLEKVAAAAEAGKTAVKGS